VGIGKLAEALQLQPHFIVLGQYVSLQVSSVEQS